MTFTVTLFDYAYLEIKKSRHTIRHTFPLDRLIRQHQNLQTLRSIARITGVIVHDSKRQDLTVIAGDVRIFAAADFIFPPEAIGERVESHGRHRHTPSLFDPLGTAPVSVRERREPRATCHRGGAHCRARLVIEQCPREGQHSEVHPLGLVLYTPYCRFRRGPCPCAACLAYIRRTNIDSHGSARTHVQAKEGSSLLGYLVRMKRRRRAHAALETRPRN